MKPFRLPAIFAYGALALYLALLVARDWEVRDPERAVLRVGGAALTAAELDGAVEKLRHAFPGFGTDTLRFHLLEGGMGASSILHARAQAQSRTALEQAERWAARLRAGEDFASLVLEQGRLRLGEPVAELPAQPSPAVLGARVAAEVAVLEPGEWAGPFPTPTGWEIVRLVERYGTPRSRANVSLMRLVFPVGSEPDRAQARDDWNTLPIRGEPEYLRAIPDEMRRNRRSPR